NYAMGHEHVLKYILDILALSGSEKGLLPLIGEGNARGVYEMASLGGPVISAQDVVKNINANRIKTVYSTEILPGIEKAEFFVLQDVFESTQSGKAHAVLPSCVFVETSGSVVNTQGSVLPIRAATRPYAECRDEWLVAMEIADRMGMNWPKYDNCQTILREISDTSNMPVSGVWNNIRKNSQPHQKMDDSLFEIQQESKPFTYRGANLTEKIGDLKIVWRSLCSK
ncbi:MAG TPA: hypothetical protein ENN76_00195, partial [Euryarchaeota archaeon]|nr:hypothetical protein [Euryarchaeota archaeon]